MGKPKVSAFDWRLAEIRLSYAKYFIDQKDWGDPFDDLWFDLDSKELEIGYKPKNGVFLGEVREFRADDLKFQELYGDLAADGVFELEDVDPALFEHPYKRYAQKMEAAAAKWEPKLWTRLEFFMNAEMTDGEFFLATDYDWANYPVFVTTFDAIIPKMGGISPLEATDASFDVLAGMFDPDFYISKSLYRVSRQIMEYVRELQRTKRNLEQPSTKFYLSRGFNRVSFMRLSETADSDYPFYCGRICDFTRMARYGQRWGDAVMAGMGMLYLTPILRDKKTDGWERKV